jgi:hypothetical protein
MSKNSNKNKGNIKEKKVFMSSISLGTTADDNGLSVHTPADRYAQSIGENPNLRRVNAKLLVIEILAYLLISFSVISTVSSLFKDKPEHYIQPPDGIVERVGVRR